MDFEKNKISQITAYIEKMPENKQQMLLDALREEALVKKARSLKVKKNDISMKEICDIVNEVRKLTG
jgi:glycyl-tRNA synthetase beta subunit